MKVDCAKTKDCGLKNDEQIGSTECKSELKADISRVAEAQKGPVEKMVQRKISWKAPKKTVTCGDANTEACDNKSIQSEDGKTVNAGCVNQKVADEKLNENKVREGNNEPRSDSRAQPSDEDAKLLLNESGKTLDKVRGKEDNKSDDKEVSGAKMASIKDNHTARKEESNRSEKTTDDRERKNKDGKYGLRSKPSKDMKRKKSDVPPRHPGFILQTKSSREMKLQSVSLTLDSLLKYSVMDMEESTFELSVFAESFYEMLQYEMGCRILTFLQKLLVKFVIKRNKRKRERGQSAEKQKEETKRLKTEEALFEEEASKSQLNDEPQSSNEKSAREDTMESVEATEGENVMLEDGEETEDPEKVSEEDESYENNEEKGKPGSINTEQKQLQGDVQHTDNRTADLRFNFFTYSAKRVSQLESKKENAKVIEKKASCDAEGSKPKEVRDEASKKTNLVLDEVSIDKELILAFRFFDRNRAGYLKVDDLRLIILNTGKFLPHRLVKELVQCALLESNTGQDDRILYEKLVKISHEI